MNRKASGLVICFTLGATLLAACASRPPASTNMRRPASLTEDPAVNSALSEMASDKSNTEVENLVQTVARIYFRGQDYLKDFDKKLDTGTKDMMVSKEYSYLMASRILSENARARITAIYEKLLLDYWEARSKNQDVSQLKKQLSDFSASINQSRFLAGGYRIALQDLASDLAEVPLKTYVEFHGPQNKTPSEVAAQNDFNTLLFKNTNELTAYLNDKANSTDFEEKVRQAVATDKVLLKHLSILAPKIQRQLKDNANGREPQSTNSIFPSRGTSGNISGDSFPAGLWVLTFDDGPSSKNTPSILSNLNEKGLKASFFWLAKNVNGASSAKIILTAKAMGMELNNHSYSHPNLVSLGGSSLQREVITSTEIEAEAFGSAPKYFRCPYGSCLTSTRVRDMIAAQDMIHVFWNVDSLDWQDRNPTSIYKRVKKQMDLNGRGIILFHDIHPQSVIASKMTMDDLAELEAQGKTRLRTIDQAVKEMNGK